MFSFGYQVLRGALLIHLGDRVYSQNMTSLSPLHPDRNLALELVRATEAAAIRATPFIGKGDKLGADGAAVDAMRAFLSTVEFDGTVVIGEGEKDNAPMLFNGERVGTGMGPSCDIAVDPIDGTSLAAAGRQNAISVIAASDKGTMLDASSVYYMNKLVAGPEGIGVVDIRQSIGENIRAIAKAKGKNVADVIVAVLDRPRHADLIEDIRAAGAGTRLLLDGDVAGGLHAARYGSRIDLCIGIGGSPEGVVTTCAVKGLGGIVQGILHPMNDEERARGLAAGLKFDYVYEMDELVASDNTFFVATGVTDGGFLDGVRRKGPIIKTHSIAIRSKSGTVREVYAEHNADRWF